MKIDIQNTTNLFESKTGALNIAPVKISGQYKIVVTLNGDLYFDDYNGKRSFINKNQQFLPQLGNFLRTPSLIQDYNKLKYGGFSNKQLFSYHAPFFIGQKNNEEECVPDYFIINNIGYGNSFDTNNIDDTTKLGNISKTVNIFDLNKLGLKNIFKEITDNLYFQFPFYSNFDLNKITIFGFDYIKSSVTKKEFSLLDYFANQTNFEASNNYILNLFNNNNLIFPKFLNIEFEFDDESNANNLFSNYYGYYSYENIFNQEKFNELKTNNKYGIFSRQFIENNSLIQKQVFNNNSEKLKVSLFNVYTLDTSNQIPFARLKFNYLVENDTITFYNDDNSIFFEYTVTASNLKSSFRETLISITNSIIKSSEKQINCYLDNKLLNTINFEIQSGASNIYIKKSLQLNQYEFIDLFNVYEDNLLFKEIDDSCLIINNIFDTTKIESKQGKYIKLNSEKYYEISDYFIYKGNLVCKVKDENFEISQIRYNNLLVKIYDEIESKFYYHNPITFLNYIKNDIIVKSNVQFDKDKYVEELDQKFNTTEFQLALNSFKNYKAKDVLPFLNYNYDNTGILENNYPDANKDFVLNMKFNSGGFTSFFDPNFFNFDLRFYDNNGNIILENLDSDRIRFHWFLIKSKCPEYLKDKSKYGLSSLRFFTDKPQITSRLIDTGTYCETIFLGVKYYLPRKYKDYQFAVYLDYNNYDIFVEDSDLIDNNFLFEVNTETNTLYLKINKYLDFVDLIRDGDKREKPFIDLSFFYTTRQSYNTKSDLVMTFKNGGLLMCDDKIPTFFNGQIIHDWKTQINGKWFICLKRSNLVNTAPLTDLIQTSGDVHFYVYSKMKGIRYQTMEYIIKGIQYVANDYVWCEDIQIKFFDNKNLIINELDQTTLKDVIYKFTTDVDPDNDSYIVITEDDIQTINKPENTFENEKAILTVQIGNDNKVFNIINSKETFSLKENYIETVSTVNYNPDGSKFVNYTHFKFPEYNQNFTKWVQMVINEFEEISEYQKITIFNRNQIWYIIKSLIQTELKFKNNTESQTIKLINELLLSNLYEYSALENIPIENIPNEYIKMSVVKNDYNVVIWNLQEIDNTTKEKIAKIARYSGPYFPHFDEINNLSEFQTINHFKNQIINIFDKSFGNIFKEEQKISLLGYNKKKRKELNFQNVISTNFDYDINAIGLWKELEGNIVSSLFNKKDDIIIKLRNTQSSIIDLNFLFDLNNQFVNINQNLFDQFTFSNLFPENNSKYISYYNKNINEYIYNKGIDWIINNYYNLDSVVDSDNKKIKFTFDNNQIIINESNYQPNGSYTFNFKRK